MLSAKPWKLDAMVRLLISVFICITAGSLLVGLMHSAGVSGRLGWKLGLTATGAFGFLATSLLLLRRTLSPENFLRDLTVLVFCLYAGFVLALWAQKLAGPPGTQMSAGQMLVGVLSAQGAGLLLARQFLREHQLSWNEAFGFSNLWLHAVLIGMIAACLFLPVARGLQWGSVELFKHIPHFPFKLEEQQAVQVLRISSTWVSRLVLGLATILLAPVAEEVFFRGILYPWLKQSGFPRLALWISAAAFAAMHLNILIFVPLLVLAVVLTLLYERTNNLLAPIAAHSLFNALNFAMLYLLEKRLS